MNIDFTLELVAVITGVLSVYLLTKQRIEAWYFGLVTVSIYVYIFLQQKLYSDMILHVVYVVLNIYGWYSWKYGDAKHKELKPTMLSWGQRMIWIIIIVIGFLIWGYLMNRYTDADYAYVDAFTTVTSLVAQWFLAKKKIENWVLWMIVNVIAIGLYYVKGIVLTSGLYAIYLILAFMGFFSWKKNLSGENVFHTS